MSEPTDLVAVLRRLHAADHPPRPGAGTGQVPWNDPEFSERMLRVHLDPTTHMASRAPDIITRHVDWLLAQADGAGLEAPLQVLDAGCGPGLYLLELARRGHGGTGLDFAPAPLAWARSEAARRGTDLAFVAADLTALPPDLATTCGPVDMVTLWFGEFHTFAPDSARRMLADLVACLRPGGLFVLEYQPWDLFCREDTTTWSMEESSVFSDRPHLWLQEFGWDESGRREIHVHWILDSESGNLERYEQIHHAWPEADLLAALAEAGLSGPAFHPPITGVAEEFEFPVLVARRTG